MIINMNANEKLCLPGDISSSETVSSSTVVVTNDQS